MKNSLNQPQSYTYDPIGDAEVAMVEELRTMRRPDGDIWEPYFFIFGAADLTDLSRYHRKVAYWRLVANGTILRWPLGIIRLAEDGMGGWNSPPLALPKRCASIIERAEQTVNRPDPLFQ